MLENELDDEELRMLIIKKRNDEAINFLKGKYDDERRNKAAGCYKGFISTQLSAQEEG